MDNHLKKTVISFGNAEQMYYICCRMNDNIVYHQPNEGRLAESGENEEAGGAVIQRQKEQTENRRKEGRGGMGKKPF